MAAAKPAVITITLSAVGASTYRATVSGWMLLEQGRYGSGWSRVVSLPEVSRNATSREVLAALGAELTKLGLDTGDLAE